MNDFQAALDVVHSSLRDLRANGVRLRVTTSALAKLRSAPEAAAARQIPIAVTTRALPAEPLPAAVIAPRQTGSKAARIEELRAPTLACVRCPHLVRSRTQVVFGVGNPEAELMFVGEAPGEDEDLQGEPFVGKAGQLLTKIISAMGYEREQIYIANVLKCRPDMPLGESGNRKPRADEMQTCLPYLKQQIDIIQPRALVALGATAMEGLLGEVKPMAQLRGRWHSFQEIPLMATYHPAYLLRNQSMTEKRKVWEDMLLVLEKLERPISDRQRGFFLSKS
jgi:DNA polymerase